ncbi:MAG: hypothetical protein AAB556_00700 [Patescibacteria group bacterium]
MTSETLIKKIPQQLKAAISQEIMAVLEDPDFGLGLSTYAKKRLLTARKSRAKTIPFSEIKKKYL